MCTNQLENSHFRFRVLLTLSSSSYKTSKFYLKKCIYIYISYIHPLISIGTALVQVFIIAHLIHYKARLFHLLKRYIYFSPNNLRWLICSDESFRWSAQMIWILSGSGPYLCVSRLIFCYSFTDVLCFYHIDCHALAVFLPLPKAEILNIYLLN